jgi:hypothetical protein
VVAIALAAMIALIAPDTKAIALGLWDLLCPAKPGVHFAFTHRRYGIGHQKKPNASEAHMKTATRLM